MEIFTRQQFGGGRVDVNFFSQLTYSQKLYQSFVDSQQHSYKQLRSM
jgi:hypothetical protein